MVEPDDKIPLLKLLERRPGEHDTFSVGPDLHPWLCALLLGNVKSEPQLSRAGSCFNRGRSHIKFEVKMTQKYTHGELTGRMASPGWKVVTGNDSMPIIGTLKQMLETTHDRHRKGLTSGYIQEMETAIEVDMLQIQALWRQLGLPT